MKKYLRWKLAIIISVVITAAALGWIYVYRYENPIQVERAALALNRGRGYEILLEDEKFLTKTGDHAELMQFLEGHYQMIYHTTAGETVFFLKGEKKIGFTTQQIRFNYTLWEKMD